MLDKFLKFIEYPSTQTGIVKAVGVIGSYLGWSDTKSVALAGGIYLAAEAVAALINFFRSDADVAAKQAEGK